MNFQSHVADITLQATATFLRHVKALPPEKLDWKPSPDSRSALSMMQEVAGNPRDLAKTFNGEIIPDAGSDRYVHRVNREQAEWTTLGECERVLEFNIGKLVSAIRDFPSDQLIEPVVEPWGYPTTFVELMMYQYWNTVWHTGQVAYIQTLLGDTKHY